MRATLCAFFVVPALALLVGCGSSATPQTSGDASQPNAKGLKELETSDIKVGTGQLAEEGDRVYITYTGRLMDGTAFESNDKPEAMPFTFNLGERDQVIEGWRLGIMGMKVGGVRKLRIPAHLAYGDMELGPIPANSDLEFEVRLDELVKKGEERVFDQQDLVAGSGREAKKGDHVTVEYVCTLANGKLVDSTYQKKQPVSFTLGVGQALKGVDAGMVGMKVGGKRRLRLPPETAFGRGGTGFIPGESLLFFEIELKSID